MIVNCVRAKITNIFDKYLWYGIRFLLKLIEQTGLVVETVIGYQIGV